MTSTSGLGSFPHFIAVWVAMMAAMMLPGTVPAVAGFVRANGRALAAPLFAGSYLAIWTLFGLAVFALYRPLGVMSVTWMAVVAALVLAQKLLPPRAAIDVPVALAIVGLGILILT
jgi:predicted metal-binding membrane protein